MNFYYRKKNPTKRKKYTYKDFINLSSSKIKEKLKEYSELNNESENFLKELDNIKKHYEYIRKLISSDLKKYIQEKNEKISKGKDLIHELHVKGEKGFFQKLITKEDFFPGYKEKIKSVEDTIKIIEKNISGRINKSLDKFPNKSLYLKKEKYEIIPYKDLSISFNSYNKEIEIICHKFNDYSHRAMVQKFQSQKYIQPLEKALSIISKKEEQVNKLKEETKKYKAQAYSNQQKRREESEKVKKEIKDQVDIFPLCPYCEQSLGLEPHDDHIWPISLGGLPTKENMVKVCAKCNLEKGALTLREFINKKGLDGVRVSNNLSLLGKKF